MPTITGAILQADSFIATGGLSAFKAIIGTQIKGEVGSIPFIANNTFTSAVLRAALQGQIDGVVKWSVGFNASGLFTVLDSTGGNENLTMTDAGAATVRSTITTGAPTGGAGAWKLGVVSVVTPTAPNRTVAIDVGGTVIYLHGKTTNN